jgi:hypothetical protein
MRGIVLGCAMLMVTTMVGGEAADSWVALFDGRTLDGWVQRNGAATYRVTDGAIVGRTSEGSPNSFLATEQAFSHFELEFEVRVDDALNSGVQIRSRTRELAAGEEPDERAGRVLGPQVEIEASPGLAGYVYGEAMGHGWLTSAGRRGAARALPEWGVEPLSHRRGRTPHPDMDQRRADRGPDRRSGVREPRRGLHRSAGAQHRDRYRPLRGRLAPTAPARAAGFGVIRSPPTAAAALWTKQPALALDLRRNRS